jgi:hypothetical protein
MSEHSMDIQYRFLIVNERPICIWDTDIAARSIDFLKSIDPTYFEYCADTHLGNISEDEPEDKVSQNASIALRAGYSQALETLFALLFSLIQAPYCPYAWIYEYKNQELYELVNKIREYKPILSPWDKSTFTWQSLADFVFSWFVIEDKEKEKKVKEGFSQLWSMFASQFSDEIFEKEYNSIKHGFRAHAGGFWFAMGKENKQGFPAPLESMRLMGSSKFGTHFLISEKIGNSGQNIQVKSVHRNWNPEDLAWGLHLAAMSISNVQAALQIINGTPADKTQFHYPTDIETFGEPWKRSVQIGVTSLIGFQIEIHPEFIEPFTKKEILEKFKEGKDFGSRRLIFTENHFLEHLGKPRKTNKSAS